MKGVLCLAQHEGAAGVESGHGRHEALGAGGEDQPIVGERLADPEHEPSRLAIDARRARVEPALDAPLLVPAVLHEGEPLHAGAPVDESADGHAVVELVLLAADEVYLAVRVAAADVIRGGDPGDAVAHHDHAFHLLVVGEVERARARRIGGIGRERDPHVAAHARAAGHARALAASQALDGGELVGAGRGEILHAGPNGDRVRAAHPHAAAGLDLQVVGFGHLEQGLAGRHQHTQLAGLEGDGGLVARERAIERARATGADVRLGERRDLLDEEALVTVGAHHPGDAGEGHGGLQRPRRPAGQRCIEQALCGAHHAGRAEPVEEIERERAVDGGDAQRRDLEKRIEHEERADAHEHVESELQIHARHGDLGRIRHLIEGDDEARKGGDEELAVTAVVLIVVVLICDVGDVRIEIVTVLGAAEAGLAMAVRERHEGRLAVDALHGQQRADAAAPAALTLEQHAAEECERERAEHHHCHGVRIVVEQQLAPGDEREEEGDGNEVVVFLEPSGCAAPEREAEESGQLIRGGERAQVAPQSRDEEEDERERRHDQPPEREQAAIGIVDEPPAHGEHRADARELQCAPHRDRQAAPHLHVVRKCRRVAHRLNRPISR